MFQFYRINEFHSLTNSVERYMIFSSGGMDYAHSKRIG